MISNNLLNGEVRSVKSLTVQNGPPVILTVETLTDDFNSVCLVNPFKLKRNFPGVKLVP